MAAALCSCAGKDGRKTLTATLHVCVCACVDVSACVCVRVRTHLTLVERNERMEPTHGSHTLRRKSVNGKKFQEPVSNRNVNCMHGAVSLAEYWGFNLFAAQTHLSQRRNKTD